jgi:hypothetical protein
MNNPTNLVPGHPMGHPMMGNNEDLARMMQNFPQKAQNGDNYNGGIPA